MQHFYAVYMTFALYLTAAMSMTGEMATTNTSSYLAGSNNGNIMISLLSGTNEATAGENKSKKMVGPRIDITKPDLSAQLTAVHDALKKTRMFSEMPLPELNKLNASFQSLTQSRSQIDEALKANRVPDESWLQEQKTINAILDKSEADSRLVCVTEKLTGSHRSKRVCRTAAEVARLEQKAKDNWQRRGESQLDAPRKANE